jgi:polyisoprenoid-binding protein YceI
MKLYKIYTFALLIIVLCAAFTFRVGNSRKVQVDPVESTVEWTGKKLTGEHYGNISIKNGSLELNGSKLSGGSFELDMGSITCKDIKDEKTNTRFINHLKSDDFFSVEEYPYSSFVITKAQHKGGDNYEITGNLTIKGTTLPLTFNANITNTNGKYIATANMKFDRSKYNVKFGSKSFFENIGDKIIYDDVEMKVRLVSATELAENN